MCVLCLEVAKELVQPKQFWNLYQELVFKDNEHLAELMSEVEKTSPEYKMKLVTESSVNND